MVVKQGEVWLVSFDPSVGSEIQKTRPALVVSPDELNGLRTVILAPMTTKGFEAPFRPSCTFQKKEGQIALDQIKSLDKRRLVHRLGTIHPKTLANALAILRSMFTP